MIKVFLFFIFCANGDVIKQERMEIPLDNGQTFMKILESDTIKDMSIVNDTIIIYNGNSL